MKTYCLTDCAKRKLSKGKKALIELGSALLFTIAFITFLVILFFIVGITTQAIYVAIYGNLIGIGIDILGTGSAISLVFLLLSIAIAIIYSISISIYKWIKAILTNTIIKDNGWSTTKCKIFEECKE